MRAIQVSHGESLSFREPQPTAWSGTSSQWKDSQDRTHEAAKIKCLRLLSAMADSQEERGTYDTMAAQFTTWSRSRLPREDRIQRAMEDLATAQVKLKRAEKVAEEANLALTRAQEMEKQAQSELVVAKTPVVASTAPSAASTSSGSQASSQIIGMVKDMLTVPQSGPITVDPMKLATLLSMHSNGSPGGQSTPKSPEVIPIYEDNGTEMDDYQDAAEAQDAKLASDLAKLLHPTGGRRRTLQLVASPARCHKKKNR